MGIFGALFTNRDTTLAVGLAEKISRHFPPSSEPKLDKIGGKRRLESVLELVMKDLDALMADEKPGWFRKARIGNTFRWKLIELGYSRGFVDALTEGVVTYLATGK